MRSILVVDDEQDILISLEMLLEEEGYQVTLARHGKEALERLAERRPDAVLIDVMMPIMSGAETIRRMKEDPEYRKIPIVLMSAVRPPFKQEDFPWDALLKKPFEIDAVLSALDKVIPKTKK